MNQQAALAAGAALAVLGGTYQVAGGRANRAVTVAGPAQHRPRTNADTVQGCHSGPLRFVAGSPASRRPCLVRRYVGTVGGQAATALLQWQHPDSITGSFYLHRGGPTYALQFADRNGGRRLHVHQDNPTDAAAGAWHLSGRPGTRLVGSWVGRGGRSQTLLLRENYTGAARLAIKTTHLRGGWANTGEPVRVCTHVPTVSRDYWHLLTPAAVPPALLPLLRPPLATRRRATRALRDSEAHVTAGLSVQLNDWHLLSYLTYYNTEPFAGHDIPSVRAAPLLDLAAGRTWSLGQLLRPGYRTALSRRTGRHLLHDAKFRDFAWSWAEKSVSSLANDTAMNHVLWLRRDIVPRPEAYAFTGAGLELSYHPNNLAENQHFGDWQTTVLIPYRELRPLVRPGTPLARMLRARGMW